MNLRFRGQNEYSCVTQSEFITSGRAEDLCMAKAEDIGSSTGSDCIDS